MPTVKLLSHVLGEQYQRGHRIHGVSKKEMVYKVNRKILISYM